MDCVQERIHTLCVGADTQSVCRSGYIQCVQEQKLLALKRAIQSTTVFQMLNTHLTENVAAVTTRKAFIYPTVYGSMLRMQTAILSRRYCLQYSNKHIVLFIVVQCYTVLFKLLPLPQQRCGPKPIIDSPFLRFLGHTQGRTRVGRTALDDLR